MAHNSLSFFSNAQAVDHGDHGDHSLHGDFIATSGTPSIAAPSLIMNHAVLSGPWAWPRKDWTPDYLPEPLAFNDPANVLLWSPDVRTMIVQQEIASNVVVKAQKKSQKVSKDAQESCVIQEKAVVCARNGSCDKLLISCIERPSAVSFAEQLHFLEFYADQRLERVAEITLQLTDIISNFSAIVPLRPERKRWTLEFIRICLRAVSLVEMQVKHILACRRPDELWPQVQPMIQTPSHSSFPSGHGTEAFLVAILLRHFAKTTANSKQDEWLKEVTTQLVRQATRIAQNRVVAGVHFPIDNAAGAILGVSFANFVLQLAGAEGDDLFGRDFQSEKFGGANDFTHSIADGINDNEPLSTKDKVVFSNVREMEITATNESALAAVYREAQKEWNDPVLSSSSSQ